MSTTPTKQSFNTVTIWHNVSRDGLDRPLGMILGYQPEHEFTPVARYVDDTPFHEEGDARVLAGEAFQTFNIGDDPDHNTGIEPERVALAVAYRANKNRSLSVGDVVQVGGIWLACARFGWERIDSPANLVWRRVHGSTPLPPEGEAERPLTWADVMGLEQVGVAAERGHQVRRLIDEQVFTGTARSIGDAEGAQSRLASQSDVRDRFLRVTLAISGVDVFWPVMVLAQELHEGTFTVDQ